MSRWPDVAALTLLLLLVLLTTYENVRGTALRYRMGRTEVEMLRLQRWVESRRAALRRETNADSTWRAAVALGVPPLFEAPRRRPAVAVALGREP